MQDTVRVRYGLHRQRLATLPARLEQHAVPFLDHRRLQFQQYECRPGGVKR